MQSHRRAAAREREAARALGTKRVRRGRYESAPDVQPVVTPSGLVLSVEVKTRAKVPALVKGALMQASRYATAPDAVPVLVVSELGASALVVLSLDSFAALVGLAEPVRQQPSIFTSTATPLVELVARVGRGG